MESRRPCLLFKHCCFLFFFFFSVVRNDVIDDGPVLGRRFNLHSDGLLQLAQVDS